MNTINLNGIEYVPLSDVNNEKAKELDGMPYQIVRTYSAGVFAGYIENREGKEVTIRNARRIWYWEGAASLSQLAVDGTCRPENCKFPTPVDRILVTEAIEILDVTEKARKSIESVPVWKAE